MTSPEPAVARRVFLSYAYDDRALAQRIRDVLARSGVRTTDQIWEVSSGEALTVRLRESIRASDVVVVLLSPAAAASPWVSTEIELALSRDLDQRGAELIPVLAAPTDLPPALRNRAVVDLTGDVNAGVRQLVEQMQATSQADFSAMSPREFEDLVADLLQAVGFRLDEVWHGLHPGVDLRVTYQRVDPFGWPETEVWLVETKLYSHQCVSVEAIRQLAGFVSMAPSGTRGLLVTNVQLTSVAREYVVELERRPSVRLRVLDGVELKWLLRQFPAVAARHFGAETGPDGDS